MKEILIIEDNEKIKEELKTFLNNNGYSTSSIDEFKNVAQQVLTIAPDLVLLDINLPCADGIYICKEIRKESAVPIIIVTSRNTEIDELMSINFGADDFVTKPYNTQILLARINNIFKRTSSSAGQNKIDAGLFVLDISKSVVEINKKEIELTKNELRILHILVQKRGQIVSRDDIMAYLWDSAMFVDDNTLTVNINRLRKKLESELLANVIETRRGQGYIIK
ncbi:MAG: response regulator transcription factor [Clostridia bacterium]